MKLFFEASRSGRLGLNHGVAAPRERHKKTRKVRVQMKLLKNYFFLIRGTVKAASVRIENNKSTVSLFKLGRK